MIKLAVDAYPLTVPMAGIGRYTQQILIELLNNPKYVNINIELYSAVEITDEELIALNFTQDNIHKIKRIHFSFLGYHLPSIKKTKSKYLQIIIKIFSHLWAYWEIARLIKKNPPTVFWSPMHHLPAKIPEKTLSVVTIHDLTIYRYPQTMNFFNRQIEKILLPKAIAQAQIIFNDCNSIKAEIIEKFDDLAHDKISVIYCAVEHNTNNYKNNIELNTHNVLIKYDINCNYILFVGTREPRKNLKNLIAAYQKIDKKLQDTNQLIIAGNLGWGKQENITNPNVRFIGIVDDADLQILYQNALFLAMPSLYEGFGFPILEAMCQRCAVLTSNFGATAEIAGVHSRTAHLINPLDIDDIYNGIIKLIEDKEYRQNLSNNGFSHVKKFSWADTVTEFIDTISQHLK